MSGGLQEYIMRWRHTRGYGVHSPLAYRIVKECVRPDNLYGFYSDAYTDFNYHEDYEGRRNTRLTVRLLNLLRPKMVWMPEADKRMVTAIRMSMPSMRISTQKGFPKDTDFIVASNSENAVELWHKMDVETECSLLIFGKSASTSIHENRPTLTIASRNFTLMLRRKGMQPIEYPIL